MERLRFDKQQISELYQYAMALCQDSSDAHDVLQASLERYWLETSSPHTEIRDAQRYIRTLIRNRFIDQYRYAQRWHEQQYEEDSTYDMSFDNLEQLIIDRDTLAHVWEQVPPELRDILYHWAVLGMSTEEVSQHLNMPKGTLLSKVHRLRIKLEALNDDFTLREAKP
ncbi:RNA polymerase sigma factor [Echinimonas agarilytica]|uniref:RNA polymerase sigma factor n=1 Tax=Echinimonas agarilytica TaxID=1215918 RepID=A0AA42B6U2_9GAMM|nr:RNA polymerase sigma factor [Echinimonas agarilytica]MCM2679149.1 RNA polymerase sigma factor [Echinimonas agarilytica]